jgi:hypothetical protein
MKEDKIKTTETYIQEYLKCKNDFNHYISNYILLELPGGDVKIKPYEKQLELIETINREHYVIVVKSRQIGISTIIQAYISWLVVFNDNVVCGIISKDGMAATKFSRFIASFIDKLPIWMRPKFDKRNERSFILKNGSKVFNTPVDPKNPTNCFRGESITFLVIDEAAFVQKIDIAWTGIVPALATNQKCAKENGVPYGTIILSTPNKTVGTGKFFYSRYQNAMAGNDIFQAFIIHWKMIKELNEEWFQTQCQLFDNDLRKIQQELELKFLPTGGSFFDEKTNIVLQDNPINPFEIHKIFNGEIRIYEKPIPGRHYIMGVDSAPENGSDKSAIVVFDYMTMTQVWEYHAKCAVTDLCKIVELACATYPGTCVIENNSIGNQVMETMSRSVYHTMVYKEKKRNKKGELTQIIPGIFLDKLNRPLVIDALYSYVTEYPTTIKSKNLALELIGLITKPSGKVEADTDCHDDLVMAAAFCYFVRKYDPPLMIVEDHAEEIMDLDMIFNMNSDNFRPFDISGNKEVDNFAIIKKIKQQMTESKLNKYGNFSVVDVFDIINKD